MALTTYRSLFFLLCGLACVTAIQATNKMNPETRIKPAMMPAASPSRIPGAPADKLFEKILSLNKARIGTSGQIILVTNEYPESPDVTIRTFEKKDGQWVEKFSKTTGTIGYHGFAPYKKKVEGDGTTPTGVFFLGPVYGYPGVKVTTKMEFWVASENDYWIDDVKSGQYNRWVTSDTPPDVTHEEMKRSDDKYKYGIAVQYNMDQVKMKGSVITIHLLLVARKKTSGCIAIPQQPLLEIIGWLDPAKKPLIIMGTLDELDTSPVSGPGLDKNDKYIWKKEPYIPVAR